MRLVFWLCFITMAQGSDGKSGVGDKSLQELIDQINSEPHYRVVPRVEYESLVRMKTNPSFGHPPVSTPKPVVHPAVSTPKFFPRASIRSPMLFNSSALYQNPNPNPIKLPTFSGSEPQQKGEVSFEVWSYEVRCLKNQYPEHLILQSVRSSLKGLAREMLIPLGESASVDDILHRLEDFYGNVCTAENIMQSFYSDHQKEGESIVSYGLRLEQTVSKAVRLGHIDVVAKDSMLKSKFWSGLRNQQLRNASRQKYETVRDFQSLMREIRQIEQEEKSLDSVSKPVQNSTLSPSVDAFHVSNDYLQKQLAELFSQMKKLDSRMSKLEQDQKNFSNTSDSFQTSNPQGQNNSYRRGKGKSRGQTGNKGYGRGQENSESKN